MAVRTYLWVAVATLSFGLAGGAYAQNAAQAIAQKFSEADKPKSAERPSLDYEMDMLRRARAEEAEREKHAKPIAATAPAVAPAPSSPAAQPAAATTAASPSQAAAPSKAQEQKAPPASVEKFLETEAPAPPQSSKPAEPPVTASPAPAAASPSPPREVTTAKASDESAKAAAPAPVAELPALASPDGGRATVLLSLATDSPAAAHPDPIICLGATCWLSNGIKAAAKPILRAQVLALQSTQMASDDSCHGKSACVYRNVTIPDGAVLEVIEVGHPNDPTIGGYSIDADKSCRLDEGDLICNNPLETRDYRLWIVPEATATSVGPAALESAVADDLEGDDTVSASDK